MGTIYVLENTTTGKRYVGQTTTDLKERLRTHKYGKQVIDLAIAKYGMKKFRIHVFLGVPNEDLDTCERGLILNLKSISPNGYNLDSGGSLNKRHSAETKSKISKKAKERVGPKNNRYGKHHSEETKAVMSALAKLRDNSHIHSPECREKVAAMLRGRKRVLTVGAA